MPKLAIYVPKKDMRKIERWRKKINFSQVFMRALQMEIRDREASGATGTEDQLQQAADYYRRQLLAQGDDQARKRAFDLGQRQVYQCRLPPAEIRELLPLAAEDQLSDAQLQRVADIAGPTAEQLAQSLMVDSLDDVSRATCRHALLHTYTKGVAAAWEQVCREMQHTETETT